MASKKAVTEHVFLQTDELHKLIAARYQGDGFIVLDEVRNSTGFSASRSCDVIVVGTWPSHGFRITGFEVKRDRSDWLRELKNPKKANDMQKFCDEWVVVANHGVVQLDKDHIPDTWAVWEPSAKGDKLITVKTPIISDKRGDIDRGFLCALLRRASNSSLGAKAAEKLVKETRAQMKQTYEYETKALQDRYNTLNETVTIFEKASGVSVARTWRGDNIGDAVRRVMMGPDAIKEAVADMQRLHRMAKNMLEAIERELPQTQDATTT